MSEYPQPQPASTSTTALNSTASPPTSSFALPPPALDDPTIKRANRKAIVTGILIAVLGVVLLAVVIYLLLLDPVRTANIRDIVIILTAVVFIFMSIATGVLLVILIYRLQELIHFLRAELVPLLTKVQQTASTVRGTTTFVSDNVAKPAIKVAGFVSGVQQMAKTANSKVKGRTGR